jgi:hypothetical protein
MALSVRIRSMLTPWSANQVCARRRNPAHACWFSPPASVLMTST